MKFKTTSSELNKILPILIELLLERRKFTNNDIAQFNKIGITAIKTRKHIKLYVKNKIVILSATPSDLNAGRQALREIRKIYERKL